MQQIEFKDSRGRIWESFTDRSYFDLICVRVKSNREFNSETSFHFMRQSEADQFIELIKVSS